MKDDDKKLYALIVKELKKAKIPKTSEKGIKALEAIPRRRWSKEAPFVKDLGEF